MLNATGVGKGWLLRTEGAEDTFQTRPGSHGAMGLDCRERGGAVKTPLNTHSSGPEAAQGPGKALLSAHDFASHSDTGQLPSAWVSLEIRQKSASSSTSPYESVLLLSKNFPTL